MWGSIGWSSPDSFPVKGILRVPRLRSQEEKKVKGKEWLSQQSSNSVTDRGVEKTHDDLGPLIVDDGVVRGVVG